MTPSLPAAFIARIREQLGEEADAFLRSFSEPRAYGLRFNPLKPDAPRQAKGRLPLPQPVETDWGLKPIPWCPDGYFYDETARPGKHPYHAAGLIYIQEPSAMIAAELLDPRPGDLVLDLAAAPGGKTTQLAGKMNGRGLLVANEIHPARARILSENVERMGIANAVVVSAAPGQLAERWPQAFDRIMLDAPCSGEGMFRKDPEAIVEWSPDAVETCAARQRDILPDAAAMLKPGGRLVYSTCTFNRAENEETIAWFLRGHPDFALLAEHRMWPHRGEGEGHYAAVLERQASATAETERPSSAASRKGGRSGKPSAASAAADAALQSYRAFAADALPGYELLADGVPLLFGEALYWFPQPPGSSVLPAALAGLKAPRPGLHLGDVRKGRFKPGHALALAVRSEQAALSADYPPDAPEVAAYRRGESLPAPSGERGWGLLSVGGHPLGWFKSSDGWRKNRYPKGLRIQG
ncbi:RsmB/NOP family class I SAM-dependent RNA methyltransferase [Cohnella nanjingensis]|uniref:RsmF rRNA methyltransferase first C-terminal domain-containing protein n=1 Tax=Cohnella nanjingensis TaxID=1387779 RepID=A0A7X0RXU5_9BACL|nr:RsmB/NOP family class I SAM-dependent RNA methyltransferase [Cohnella nanjingensis]MBB6674340.1 RsmF rRNA methyltransferase first C-terminal domain-containing protein [Cohnella nanjingensis]